MLRIYFFGVYSCVLSTLRGARVPVCPVRVRALRLSPLRLYPTLDAELRQGGPYPLFQILEIGHNISQIYASNLKSTSSGFTQNCYLTQECSKISFKIEQIIHIGL